MFFTKCALLFAQSCLKFNFNVFQNLSQHLTNIFRHTTMFILMLATLVYCIIQGYQSIMITLIKHKMKKYYVTAVILGGYPTFLIDSFVLKSVIQSINVSNLMRNSYNLNKYRSYYIINISLQYSQWVTFHVDLSVENIYDLHYVHLI